MTQLVDAAQQSRRELAALARGSVFVEQHVTEPLLEAIDRVQSRMLGQVSLELEALRRREV